MSRTGAIEAALEVARRPTTGPGERDAAIAGALRLISAAGLDPDDFDIPGRKRTKPKPPPASAFRENLFARERSPLWNPPEIDAEIFADVMRSLRRAQERVREQMNDPAYKREVEEFLREHNAKRAGK